MKRFSVTDLDGLFERLLAEIESGETHEQAAARRVKAVEHLPERHAMRDPLEVLIRKEREQTRKKRKRGA